MGSFNVHFYSWFAPGTVDPRVESGFKSVMAYHGLSEYVTIIEDEFKHIEQSLHYKHGYCIDQVMQEEKHDVTVFVDVDFLLTNLDSVYDLCRFAYYQSSFAGVAHNVGHIDKPHHLFAGAPLLAISRKGYERIGKPSAIAGLNHDTAQLWSLEAERLKIPYFAAYPIGYDWSPIGFFGNYGPIGRGVHYRCGYHLLGGSEESWQTLKDTRDQAIVRFTQIADLILEGEGLRIQPRFLCNDLVQSTPDEFNQEEI